MKKPFIDPKMTKCEQPLDKVTMGVTTYCNDIPKEVDSVDMFKAQR